MEGRLEGEGRDAPRGAERAVGRGGESPALGAPGCWELATDLAEHRFEQNIVALVPGHEEQAGELAALLPSSMRVVLDPEATRLAGALQLESTPFALEIERGAVTRKAYLHQGATDLIEFVEFGNSAAEKKNFVEITEKEEIEGG